MTAALLARRSPTLRGSAEPTQSRRFKAVLLQQARLRAGQQVLDLACGTATLTIAAKRMQPRADITGVDGDPDILARARVKAAKAEAELKFDESLSQHLAYADSSFDVVLSSLFFHHLDRENKLATLSEVWRVLKPGAELHIADWGKAANPLMRVLFLIVQMLDGFATTTDNVAGRLPEFLRASGFKEVEETQRFSTVLGTLALYRAKR